MLTVFKKKSCLDRTKNLKNSERTKWRCSYRNSFHRLTQGIYIRSLVLFFSNTRWHFYLIIKISNIIGRPWVSSLQAEYIFFHPCMTKPLVSPSSVSVGAMFRYCIYGYVYRRDACQTTSTQSPHLCHTIVRFSTVFR